jgi:hypothetical protein
MSPHYCDICGDFEGNRKSVIEHVEDSHTGVDPSSDTVLRYPEVVQ